MTDIFTLGIKADTTDIDRGADRLDDFAGSADKAETKTKQLREGVNSAGKAVVAFGAVAAAAMGAVTIAAGETAMEITNLARVSGLSATEFQKAAFAVKTYGIEQDKLADIFKDTQDKVGDFLAEGGGELAQFFTEIAPKVGVTAAEFRNLNGKDALQLYVSTLEKANLSQSEMVTHMERIASDSTLLQPLLANNGREFERMGKRAEELGVVLDELDISTLNAMNTTLTELGVQSKATADIIGATFAPFVDDLGQKFLDASISGDTLREGLTETIGVGVRVAGVFADAGRVFEIFGKAIGATAFTLVESFNTMDQRLDGFANGFALTFANIQLDLVKWVNEQDALLADWSSSVVNAADVFDLFDDVTIQPQPLDTSLLQAEVDALTSAGQEIEDSLVTSNKNIENAWQDVRNLMMEELPSAGMTKWFDEIEKVVGAQRKLQKEVKKTGKITKVVTTESAEGEQKANDAKTKGQISSFKEILGFAMSTQDEQSKGRENLHKVEMAFTALETTMALEKAAANALTAITTQGQGDPYTAFARIAAMGAIMGGLGVFSGNAGGGGSVAPSTPGTGTVLGDTDAVSESLTASSDRFEDLQIDQLSELRGIRNALSDVNAGISLLARDLTVAGGVGKFGGDLSSSAAGDSGIGKLLSGEAFGLDIGGLGGKLVSSLFGKTSQKVIDSGIQFIGQTLGEIMEDGFAAGNTFFDIETTKKKLFGAIKKTKTRTDLGDLDTAFSEGIGQIFTSIGNTVLESAKVLGFETVEIVKRLPPIFESFDPRDFVGKGPGEIREMFQESFETVSVSLEEALDNFQIDLGRISLEGLSGEEIEEQLGAIFSQQADLITEHLVPGISEFQQIGEGLFETLTRVAFEQTLFNDALEVMGISLSGLSNIMQIEIAQTVIDLTGGVERFADLSNTFFSEFFTEAEQFERLSNSVTDAVQGLGLTMFESREDYRAMVEGIDLTTEAGQQMFASLLELAPFMAEYFDQLENIELAPIIAEEERLEEVRDAEAEAAAELAAALAAEEAAAKSLTREINNLVMEMEKAANSAFKGLVASVKAQQTELAEQLDAELSGIQVDFDARRAEVENKTASRVASLNDQISIMGNTVSELSSLSGSISGALGNVTNADRGAAFSELEKALASGNLTGKNLQASIGTVSNIDSGSFGSALDEQRERARTANILGDLGSMTNDQLSAAERTVEMLERQITTVETIGERQIEELDRLQLEAEEAAESRFQAEFDQLQSIIDTAQEELNAVLGIESGVLSIADAQVVFNDRLADLAAAVQVQVDDAMRNNADAENEARVAAEKLQLEQRETNERTAEILTAVAIASAKTAKVLSNWDNDGQPTERTA